MQACIRWQCWSKRWPVLVAKKRKGQGAGGGDAGEGGAGEGGAGAGGAGEGGAGEGDCTLHQCPVMHRT